MAAINNKNDLKSPTGPIIIKIPSKFLGFPITRCPYIIITTKIKIMIRAPTII